MLPRGCLGCSERHRGWVLASFAHRSPGSHPAARSAACVTTVRRATRPEAVRAFTREPTKLAVRADAMVIVMPQRQRLQAGWASHPARLCFCHLSTG